MKRNIIILLLFFNLLSCRGQDFIDWVQTESATPCTEGTGLRYNWYAITDVRNIANTGWHVPSRTEYTDLVTYLTDNGFGYEGSGNDVAKSIADKTSWNYYATPGTIGNDLSTNNSAYLNIKSAGNRRSTDGAWLGTGDGAYFHTATQYNGTTSYSMHMHHNQSVVTINQATGKNEGTGIRLIKDSTTLAHGQSGIYTDNSGNVYRTICIGTKELLADNLRDTHFRNGDIIPFHGADNGNNFTDAEWAALVTAGCCAYNSDVANVGCDFTFPTE